MTTLRRRMLEDLQLRGLAPRTQQCDIEAVKQLAQHDRRAPDQLNEEEIRQYFLYLLNDKKVAESTFRIHLYGIRFFYEVPCSAHGRSSTSCGPGTAKNCPSC